MLWRKTRGRKQNLNEHSNSCKDRASRRRPVVVNEEENGGRSVSEGKRLSNSGITRKEDNLEKTNNEVRPTKNGFNEVTETSATSQNKAIMGASSQEGHGRGCIWVGANGT